MQTDRAKQPLLLKYGKFAALIFFIVASNYIFKTYYIIPLAQKDVDKHLPSVDYVGICFYLASFIFLLLSLLALLKQKNTQRFVLFASLFLYFYYLAYQLQSLVCETCSKVWSLQNRASEACLFVVSNSSLSCLKATAYNKNNKWSESWSVNYKCCAMVTCSSHLGSIGRNKD